MKDNKHQWEYFARGKIKVVACSNCGDINHSTNSEKYCERKELSDSLIFRAGYRQVDLRAAG